MTDRGCIGLPSVYSHTSPTCLGCEARTECAEKAYGTLQRVRTAIKVDDLLKRFELSFVAPELMSRTIQLTGAQRGALAVMPTKVAGRLEALFLQGFDRIAVARFAKGENPFPRTGAKHLRLAGQFLLSGGMTKTMFREECIARFGWTAGTAFSEVSQALALLRGLGLTEEINNRVQLRQHPDQTLTP